jgi:TolA-binding protein
MNEMTMFPFMVGLILSTAILSSLITTALPTLIQRWSTFKSRIKRKLTRKPKTIEQHNVEVLVEKVNEIEEVGKKMIYKLKEKEDQIDDLQIQVDNLAERLATRDTNRKNNTRRVVREYLEELKNG